ncbi:MAG: calcium-binding protein, partial [Alphaproteobacteria bacterium]
DRLSGALGNDTLFGGLGSDMADYSYLTGAGSGFAATLNAGATVAVTVAAGSDVDKLVSIENIVGGSGNDVLIGDGVDNSIEGGAGNDLIDGGDGNDSLKGNLGNDTLVGGAGNDMIWGDAGQDLVSYAADPSASFGIYLRKGIGGDVLVDLNFVDTDTLYTVEEVMGSDASDTLSMAEASQFDDPLILNGGNGNDVLVGRKGSITGPSSLSDKLSGGSGDDSYHLAGRAEVTGNVLYDFSVALPTIENLEGFSETIKVYAGSGFAGDFSTGYFEFAQITEAYDGTNSGFSAPGNAVFVIDTSPGAGYLYLDTDVTSPGYSVIARVLNGADNLTSANLFAVDGNSTPPP